MPVVQIVQVLLQSWILVQSLGLLTLVAKARTKTSGDWLLCSLGATYILWSLSLLFQSSASLAGKNECAWSLGLIQPWSQLVHWAVVALLAARSHVICKTQRDWTGHQVGLATSLTWLGCGLITCLTDGNWAQQLLPSGAWCYIAPNSVLVGFLVAGWIMSIVTCLASYGQVYIISKRSLSQRQQLATQQVMHRMTLRSILYLISLVSSGVVLTLYVWTNVSDLVLLFGTSVVYLAESALYWANHVELHRWIFRHFVCCRKYLPSFALVQLRGHTTVVRGMGQQPKSPSIQRSLPSSSPRVAWAIGADPGLRITILAPPEPPILISSSTPATPVPSPLLLTASSSPSIHASPPRPCAPLPLAPTSPGTPSAGSDPRTERRNPRPWPSAPSPGTVAPTVVHTSFSTA